jgi:hypothetical protein
MPVVPVARSPRLVLARAEAAAAQVRLVKALRQYTQQATAATAFSLRSTAHQRRVRAAVAAGGILAQPALVVVVEWAAEVLGEIQGSLACLEPKTQAGAVEVALTVPPEAAGLAAPASSSFATSLVLLVMQILLPQAVRSRKYLRTAALIRCTHSQAAARLIFSVEAAR